MNFTWFASAHDADDVPYRLLTLLQMAGVLVYAAGVPAAVEDHDFTLAVVGYVIMRAGTGHAVAPRRPPLPRPAHPLAALRRSASRVVQLLWLVILATPRSGRAAAVPRARHRRAARAVVGRAGGRGSRYWRLFHPEHIEERYGLFTIIVLGESILAATHRHPPGRHAKASRAGLIVDRRRWAPPRLRRWWLYFDHPGHLTPSPALRLPVGIHPRRRVHVARRPRRRRSTSPPRRRPDTRPNAPDRSPSPSRSPGSSLGLVLLMLATHHAVSRESIGSKLAGATVIVLLGALTPPALAVAGSAAVVVALVTLMIVDQFRRQQESNQP